MRIAVLPEGLAADDCLRTFAALGHDPFPIPYGEDLASLPGGPPDLLFSLNLHAELVRIAKGLEIPYVAWIVDPLVNRAKLAREREVAHDGCRIFSYDASQVDLYRSMGYEQVDYLPAAAALDRFRPDDSAESRGEVTFVGSPLKEEANEWVGVRKELERAAAGDPEGLGGRMLALCEEALARQRAASPAYRLPAIYEELESERGLRVQVPGPGGKETFLAALGKEAACAERVRWLEGLDGLPLTVFGPPEWESVLPGATYGGRVDYRSELPGVYAGSRVTLNLTRIYAGDAVPMRVFEAMATGVPVVTDDRPALRALFTGGEHLEIAESPVAMRTAVERLLADSAHAAAIGRAGREAVVAGHGLDRRLERMLDRSGAS